MNQNISSRVAAKRLNKSQETIQDWCRLGQLHPVERLIGIETFKLSEVERLEKRLGKQSVKNQLKSRPATLTRRPNPRLILLLKDNQPTRTTIPLFERFLSTNSLEIINKHEHQTEELLEFVISASRASDVKWASKLVHDIFRESVVALTTRI